MKKRTFNLSCSAIVVLCVAPPHAVSGGDRAAIVYQSPLPNAHFVTPQTDIIVRYEQRLDPASLRQGGPMDVTGSISGRHAGEVRISGDGRTVLFDPAVEFAMGETVAVSTAQGFRTRDGRGVVQRQFAFHIKEREAPTTLEDENILLDLERPTKTFDGRVPPSLAAEAQRALDGGDTLPSDFPHLQASVYGTPSPGRIFVADMVLSGPNISYLMILDDFGSPVFYRRTTGDAFDFKPQANGLLTYCDISQRAYYALNSAYAVVDSFRCGNGYPTDVHDLRILSNGHALLMAYDAEVVDMSQIVPGGDTAATVFGLIVQELDQEKNVVFQWRSWDHFQITDATHEDLTAHVIDYVHGNALEFDTDGNIIISCRHMDEITKISRQTGEIIWRWGGRHNEFVIANDSLFFSHQHAVRRIENGHITMFDNGNFHTPQFSRAVEYELDETNKVATLVWQYRHTPDIYGRALGYVQRLSTGNTLIGWGAAVPTVMEIQPDGSEVSELSIVDAGKFSYRAYRFEWSTTSVPVPATIPVSVSLFQNYPNPFNPTTTIPFEISQGAEVTLAVFDLLGRKVVEVLDREWMNAGEHRIGFNATNLASGVYVYRLTSGTHSLTKRALLLR